MRPGGYQTKDYMRVRIGHDEFYGDFCRKMAIFPVILPKQACKFQRHSVSRYYCVKMQQRSNWGNKKRCIARLFRFGLLEGLLWPSVWSCLLIANLLTDVFLIVAALPSG
jgi:hypothetical protein